MRTLQSFVGVFVVFCSSLGFAGPFSGLYVFGDSLSDTGNHFDLLGSPAGPYWEGRPSNGPVWVEHVAEHWGLPHPTASRLGGNNYAHAGAQTGGGLSTLPGSPVPNVGIQIESFRSGGGTFTENDLVVLWVGHNDVRGEIPASEFGANFQEHLGDLYSLGARQVLIGTLAGGSAVSHNSQLNRALRTVDMDGAHVAKFEFEKTLLSIAPDPSRHGFVHLDGRACRPCTIKNMLDPDFTVGPGGVAENADEYLFFDEAFHPTRALHAFLGSEAISAIGQIIPLIAGDADRDLDFDQLDLVQVQTAAKYLTGQPATWGEGDWDGAPGGRPDSPPVGNGLFDQLDIVAALGGNAYLTGSYGALCGTDQKGDGQTSLVCNADTGKLSGDAPAGAELTSIYIDLAAGSSTGIAAMNLGESSEKDADSNIFKTTFGHSFSSLSFGNVVQAGLSEESVLNDLSVVGSLAGRGDLGAVDVVYVPEPSTIGLVTFGLLVSFRRFRRNVSRSRPTA